MMVRGQSLTDHRITAAGGSAHSRTIGLKNVILDGVHGKNVIPGGVHQWRAQTLKTGRDEALEVTETWIIP